MKPSPFQISNIYQCYRAGLPPLTVASLLRLVPATVIAEYVRLDAQHICCAATDDCITTQPQD